MRISPSPCWQSRFPISCLRLLLLFVYETVTEFRKRGYTTNAMMVDGCLHIWAFQHLVFKSSAPGTFSPSLPLSAGLTFDVWFIGKKNHLCLWLITHIPQNFRGRTLTIGFRVKAQLHKIINTIKVGSETQNLVVQLILACCLWKHFANKAMSALLYHNGN